MGKTFFTIIIVGMIVGWMLPSEPPASRPERKVITVPRSGDDAWSGAAAASVAVPGQGIVLERASDGHFYADAQVNGTNVRFMVDTGASAVALSAEDAQRVGLPFYSHEFTAVGRGASGDVRGKFVTLDRVTLGGKSVEGVSGAILEGSELSLLGQSFLAQMGTIEIRGDKMIIS